ncbi:MAG: TetR/AcrR family transcriptional regulator C-terminal domain-containing protein [Anaerovoracaceae bacterium]
MVKGDITKKAIATAFKSLMEEKPFEQITVSQITNECGLNRLTFYYHFQDKYSLLNWIFSNEIVSLLTLNLTLDTWSSNLFTALSLMKNEKKYYLNALEYNNIEFRQYLLDIAQSVFAQAITKLADGKELGKENQKFISSFFAHGITGVIIDWVNGGMKESPKSLTDHVYNLVYECKSLAISNYLKELNK